MENGNTIQTTRVPEFDDEISVSDVHKAIFNAKREKASGIDGLPYDVFRNDTQFLFPVYIFCLMFVLIRAVFHLSGVRVL